MKVVTKTGRKVQGKIAEILVKHGNYAEIIPEPGKEDEPIIEPDPVITDDIPQVEPENEGIELDKEPVIDSEDEVQETVEEKHTEIAEQVKENEHVQKQKRVYNKKNKK
jgi:hypothetical protein